MFAASPPAEPYLCSMLRNVRVEANVGMHPWERSAERTTKLLVTIEMFRRMQNPATPAENFIDYDPIIHVLRGWKHRPHVALLETLAEELIARCFDNPRVDACRVRLLKPDIFHDAEGAGIELFCPRRNPA